jgi:hypothetical protein
MNTEKNSNQKTAKFVLMEESIPPIPLADFEGNVSYPDQGEGDYEGFYVYETTEKYAAHVIIAHGRVEFNDGKPILNQVRYRLIGTKSLDAEHRTPQGAIIWVKVKPWMRRKISKGVIEEGKQKMDEKGKPVVEFSYVWEEVQPKKA